VLEQRFVVFVLVVFVLAVNFVGFDLVLLLVVVVVVVVRTS